MDALEIHDAILVGNSLGGAVALRAAVLAPERVAALALISAPAPGVDPTPELEEAWADEERALNRGDIDAAVAAVVHTWTLPDASAELRDRVAAMQRRAFEQQADADDLTAAKDPVDEDPDVLKGLEAPVLVAVGARDREEFQRGAEVLAQSLPRARLEVIEGAGHLAPLETPEEFRQLLLSFLQEREV
jgi:pimeloyl-ACP methyl ester carboxylesterase